MLNLSARAKKIVVPIGQGRDLMVTIQQQLGEDGFAVSMLKPCRWFGLTRMSFCYRSAKAPAKVNGGTNGMAYIHSHQ